MVTMKTRCPAFSPFTKFLPILHLLHIMFKHLFCRIKEEANTGLLEHLKEDDLPNMQREDIVSHVVKLLAHKARSE